MIKKVINGEVIMSKLKDFTKLIAISALSCSVVSVLSVNAFAGTYKVSGYVSNDSKAPLAGVKAQIISGGSSTTDSNGYFEIAVSGSGTNTKVELSKAKYLKREIPNIPLTGNIVLGSQNSKVELWSGDVNQDGSINMTDVIELAKSFNTTSNSANYNSNADLNDDNSINMSDVMILAKYFNKTSLDYGSVEVNVIPVTYTNTPIPTNTPKPTNTQTHSNTPVPTNTPTPTTNQGSSGDRYFPAGTSKSELITKAGNLKVSETKAIIKKQVDEHWDVLVEVCGFKSKEKAYAFFFGFTTRESTFRAATETGSESAHSFGPLQTAETAYNNANPQYMPEKNVPEMFQYDFKDDTFYDVGISVHMGIRHFLHFARLAKEKYSGVEVLQRGLMGFNTGWVDGSSSDWIAKYAGEIGSLSGWYLKENHLSDDMFTWDTDPRVDRSNPWGWF